MSNFNPPPGEGAPTRPMNPQPTNPQPPHQQPPYQQPPYQQQPYQQQPYAPYGQPQAQPPKKGGALKWVLIGCAGFLLIGAITVGGFIWYGYNQARRAGLDTDLMRRNPMLAVAKVAVMNNPDVEFVSLDEAKNTITVRERKTGKVITINAEQIEDGEISIDEDGEEKVKIKGDSENGALDIQTPEGNVKVGSGSATNIPAWLPLYPDADIEGNYSTESKESSSVGFSFKTEDSIDEVVSFYESKLKEMGMNITKTNSQQDGQTSASVSGHDKDSKRFITVAVSVVEGTTQAFVTSQTNKK